jgi:hypothetical protein
VDRLAGLLRAIEAGLRVVVRAQEIPLHAGPRGLRHPDHAAGVRLPQVRRKALEDGAMARVVQHLRLALEVLKAGGRAELGLPCAHEGRHGAVPALVPVVIGPGVADGPAVGSGMKDLMLSSVGTLGMPSSTLKPRLMR